MVDTSGFNAERVKVHLQGRTENMDTFKVHSTGYRKILCTQLCTVVSFIIGIVGGILIGVYAFHGGPSGRTLKCVFYTSGSTLNQADTLVTSASPTSANPDVGRSDIPSASSTAPPSTNVNDVGSACSTSRPNICKRCPKRNPVNITGHLGLFDSLTKQEMEEAFDVLVNNKIISTREFVRNMTAQYVSYISDILSGKTTPKNFIYVQFMFLHPPLKQEALDHLDNGGTKPGRFAEARVIRARVENPDCMAYKIGPLGTGSASVTNLVAEGEIHINTQPRHYFDYVGVTVFLNNEVASLNKLFEESFDGARFPADLYVHVMNAPYGLTADERNSRFTINFKGFGNAEYHDVLDALPVYGMVHTPTLDPRDWYTTDFYYLDQGPFNSSADLLLAYLNDPNFRKVNLPEGYRMTLYDRIFPKRRIPVKDRDFSNIPGPRSYEPSGARYSIQDSKITWMGWEFVLSGTQLKGPNLFDIKFKGERIAYELGFNEVALIYAADTFGQNSMTYLDASYGFLEGAVILGLDCPVHGTVLNITIWNQLTASPRVLPIVCVFEADGQEAYWRHKAYTFAAGLTSHYLVVRVPISLGTYDYTIEFHFFYDGRLTTKVRSTGYIHAHFWDSDNPYAGSDKTNSPFGYRVSDYHVGSIHDHTFGFKLDLDILDSNNTFKLIHWKSGDVLDALNTQANVTKRPGYFLFNQTRYIDWETLETEEGLTLSYDNQAQWTVMNEKRTNKWGVKRGYRIVPLATSAQTFDDSFLPMKAFSFTKYHCAVTKRKDSEQYLTSQYDPNRLADPKDHLDLMLNDEPIVDEDLVTWIGVGFAHVPTSEDVPITTNVETGFMLKPHNFFDTTASFDMPQYTEMKYTNFQEKEPDHEPCYEDKVETVFNFP